MHEVYISIAYDIRYIDMNFSSDDRAGPLIMDIRRKTAIIMYDIIKRNINSILSTPHRKETNLYGRGKKYQVSVKPSRRGLYTYYPKTRHAFTHRADRTTKQSVHTTVSVTCSSSTCNV